jgi:hypothetical protein
MEGKVFWDFGRIGEYASGADDHGFKARTKLSKFFEMISETKIIHSLGVLYVIFLIFSRCGLKNLF